MVNCINLIIEMSPRFILGRGNVPCVAEVVNRSLKADCTDYNFTSSVQFSSIGHFENKMLTSLSKSTNEDRPSVIAAMLTFEKFCVVCIILSSAHTKSFIYFSLSVPAVLKWTHPKNEQNRSSSLGPRHLNHMDILRSVFPQEFLQGFL